MISIHEKNIIPRCIEKVWVQNLNRKGGTKVWGEGFVQMVLEMLSYCTPPACKPSTILTGVVESLFENPTAANII
jgi:hypothetical protein